MAAVKSPISQTLLEQLFPKKLSKSDLKKIQILESAVKTYATLGIGYISYEDIARTAKTSRPLVQHHFPDKRGLFIMAIKLVRAQFQELAVAAIIKEKDPLNQLKEYIRSTFYWLEQKPHHARVWLFFFYLCPADPEIKKLHAELTKMGQTRIAALLEGGYKAGAFSQGDYLLKASNIQRVITGALVELKTERERNAIETVREQVVHLCLQIARTSV